MEFWLAGLILLPKIKANSSFRSINPQKFHAARGKNVQMVISEFAKASWFAASYDFPAILRTRSHASQRRQAGYASTSMSHLWDRRQ
jgi:hypothetical protein